MSKQTIKPITLVAGAALAATLTAAPVQADVNPFAMSALTSGYMVSDAKDSEAKCGSNKSVSEAECGANKAAAKAKAAEGECGANKKPAAKPIVEAKCGEAKCGSNK